MGCNICFIKKVAIWKLACEMAGEMACAPFLLVEALQEEVLLTIFFTSLVFLSNFGIS
jgi:hypothetical protein